jgi:chromosome segregation ATPase
VAEDLQSTSFGVPEGWTARASAPGTKSSGRSGPAQSRRVAKAREAVAEARADVREAVHAEADAEKAARRAEQDLAAAVRRREKAEAALEARERDLADARG